MRVAILFEASPGFQLRIQKSRARVLKAVMSQSSLKRVLVSNRCIHVGEAQRRERVAILFEASPGFQRLIEPRELPELLRRNPL